jgi:pyruvate,orthophosphate dikinase
MVIASVPRLVIIGEVPPGDIGADVVGLKAQNLMRMHEAGLPVPPAFVLSTAVCRGGRASGRPPDDLDSLLADGIAALERNTGLELGGRRRPLLIAARSGAAMSMPGMLDTVLNVSLCDSTVSGLLRATGDPRFVWDSYRRLVRQYGEVVCGLEAEPFDNVISTVMRRELVTDVDELDVAALREVTAGFLEVFATEAKEPFPQSPAAQLRGAALVVLSSWDSPRAVAYRRIERLDDSGGPAYDRCPPDQPFFGDPKATLANTSGRRGRPLGDPSSRVYRPPPRLRRFVISVDARVISVDSRVISVDPRGSWGQVVV